MIIKFSDGSTAQVTDEKGRAIQEGLLRGAEWVTIEGSLHKASGIMSIEVDTKTHHLDTPLLIAPTTELTDEQRQKNIERLRVMKRKFLSRH